SEWKRAVGCEWKRRSQWKRLRPRSRLMSVRWRKGAHSFTLHRGGRGPTLATGETAARYSGMWRVDRGGGRTGRALSGYWARPHALQTGAEMFISSSVRAQKSAFYAGF